MSAFGPQPTALIYTPCSTACGFASAAPTVRRKRTPGFRLSPVIACEYGERGALTIVIEYCFTRVQ